MPRVGSTEFYAGVIRTCIEDAKFIERELANEEPRSQDVLQLLDRQAQACQAIFDQHISLVPEDIQYELKHDYQQVWKQVLKRMIMHYKATGLLIQQSREAANPTVAEVVQEPDPMVAELVVQAERITEADGAMSLAAMEVAAAPAVLPDSDCLEVYASDNEEPMPVVRMSLITCPKGYQPIDLSGQPTGSRRRNPFARRSSESRNVPGPSRDSRVGIPPRGAPTAGSERHSPPTVVQENRRTSSRGRGHHRRTNGGPVLSALAPEFHPTASHVQTVATGRRASYVWAPQKRADRPIHGVPYPPMAHERPLAPELRRNDPAIIGMAEIWTQRVGMRNPVRCAHCQFQGNHRMYECPALKKESIQRRWYHALKTGVCLNCLIIGHSSFTCTNDGCCPVHGTRHSSFLCGSSFNNQF